MRVYAKEAGYDLLSLWRTPVLFPAILFPVTFYIFFGIVFNFSSGSGQYMLVSYACFGMMGPAMFNYATAVASDRAHGWLTLKRVAPMPLSAYVAAVFQCGIRLVHCLILFVTGVFAGVELAVAMAYAVAGIAHRYPAVCPYRLIARSLFVRQRCARGGQLGLFTDGLLIWLVGTIQFLPETVQPLPGLPAYYAQLAHAVIGTSQGHSIWLLAALVGFTLLLTAIVRWRYQRLSH